MTQLAKYAAFYAFLNLEDLHKPDDDGGMAQYIAPCPISFTVNNVRPTVIFYYTEPLPDVRDILFTIPEENQTTIGIEFASGKHDARPDDRLIFTKVNLEGLRPRPAGEGQITICTLVSPDGGGNRVEVSQGSKRENADVRAVVQIPYPYEGPAYNYHKICSQ